MPSQKESKKSSNAKNSETSIKSTQISSGNEGNQKNSQKDGGQPAGPPKENKPGTQAFTKVDVHMSATEKPDKTQSVKHPQPDVKSEIIGNKGGGKGGGLRIDYPDFLDRHYRHLTVKGQPLIQYKVQEIFQLLDDAQESFAKQKTLVDVSAPIFVVGDIHGQYNDLVNIFLTLGTPPNSRYLFLGDYVDRGALSLQCICLLLAYKVLYPTHLYLLRGNHECARINKVYGFYDECRRVYQKTGRRVWLVFQKVFDEMPVYGLIENKILGMHGGLSPMMLDIQKLREIPKPIRNPNQGIINDAMWADPDQLINGWQPSTRGTSFSFGEDIVRNMCERLGIELICRAHQVCMDGYWFFANKKLVTIFSAPNYTGAMPNAGAIMHVTKDLTCSFHLFGPWEEGDANYRRIITQHQTTNDTGNSGSVNQTPPHQLEGGPINCDDVK